MFLNMLSDQQKELFLDLCLYIVHADGKYTNEEKNLVESFCCEMGIDYTSQMKSTDYVSTVRKIVAISSDYEKKIIGFELMGVVYADGIFHDEERYYIEHYSVQSGISMATMNEFGELVQQVLSLDRKIIAALE